MPFIKLTRAEYDVVQPAVWVDTNQILQMEVVGGLTARTVLTFSTVEGGRWPPAMEVTESPAEILAMMEPGAAPYSKVAGRRRSADVAVLQDYQQRR